MGKKISQLPTVTEVVGLDEVIVRDVSAGSTGTSRISLTNLWASIKGSFLGTFLWTDIDKTGSDLADLETRAGTSLTASASDILLGRASAGTGSIEEVTCTSFARSLLDDADAATARATLGITDTEESDGWRLVEGHGATILTNEIAYMPNTLSILSAWQSNELVPVGTRRRPIVANGYYYECVTAGTTGAAEPTWNTDFTAYTTDGTAEWVTHGLHVISTTKDLTSIIKKGYGIKYNYTSETTYYYGQVVYVSSNRVAIAGPYLDSSKSIQNIYVSGTKIVTKEFFFPGTYAMDNYSVGIYEVFLQNKRVVYWGQQKGYVVGFYCQHSVDDTQNTLYINVGAGGPVNQKVSLSHKSKGVIVDTDYMNRNPFGDINASYYDIDYGDKLMVIYNAGDANSDAEDLSIAFIIVME